MHSLPYIVVYTSSVVLRSILFHHPWKHPYHVLIVVIQMGGVSMLLHVLCTLLWYVQIVYVEVTNSNVSYIIIVSKYFHWILKRWAWGNYMESLIWVLENGQMEFCPVWWEMSARMIALKISGFCLTYCA